MLGNQLVGQVLANHETAPISDKLRVTLTFVKKLAKTPSAVTPEDLAPLRAAGVTDQGIADAVAVCTMFSIITRLADAFEFAIPSDGFASAAKALLGRGYK